MLGTLLADGRVEAGTTGPLALSAPARRSPLWSRGPQRGERNPDGVVHGGCAGRLRGLEHGIGELRQGPTELPGTVFESWPDDPAFEALSGEPAMSVLPTYQAAGIATVAVAVVVGVWSIWFVDRRFGGLVLVAMSVALLLVGGGFGPPLLATIAGVTAMRIGVRPPRDPGPVLRSLGRVWRWCLGVAAAAYLALVPGLPLLYLATGASVPALVLVLTVAAFGALCLVILGARGHDRRTRPPGLDEPTWNPAMTSVEWLTPPPVGTGTRFRATMGARLVMLVELTAVERPHRIASHTSSAMMTTDGAVTFVPDGEGTLLRWDWEYHLRGATRLLTPLFALLAARWERSNWVRMREWMAAQSPR